MTQTYSIEGMTCQGCVSSVKEKLLGATGVVGVEVNLEKGEAEVALSHPVPISDLKAVLSGKYQIKEKSPRENDVIKKEDEVLYGQKSKWEQLKPLFLIFGYLFSASILLNFRDWNTGEAMLDFMGLFYIVFSFFKFLDLKGFPESFRMYDPLAKVVPAYGWVYPFIELSLGLLFLMRWQIQTALFITIVILGITTFGVTKTLLDKKSIKCACLGTALNLPMTEATFIENTIMLVMATYMLLI